MTIAALNAKDCTGCLACVNACPWQCIHTQADAEGFQHPVIRIEACLRCGKCFNVCPSCNPFTLRMPDKAYAAFARDAAQTRASSSGGVFQVLAKHMITAMQGYVCGAVMGEDLMVQHILTADMEGVAHMQGSKYVQSNVAACYEEIAGLLARRVPVLFCGTPCQVAGLLRAVHAGLDCLYTADLICHGVPSPGAFRSHMRRHYQLDGLSRLTFRQQDPQDACTYCYHFYYHDRREAMVFPHQDPFYQAFLDGVSLRDCCYRCNYARAERIGDITLGDCARANAFRKADGRFTPDRAVSTVTINTPNGHRLWEAVEQHLLFAPADYQAETRLNGQLHAPMHRPLNRDAFYANLNRLPLRALKRLYCRKRSLKQRLKHIIVRHSTAVCRWNIRRGIG